MAERDRSASLSAMEAFYIFLILLAVAVVVLALWLVGQYNSLVRGRNGYRNAFAQIDVQLKRRHDLVPNLVETAKAFMKHERETLEAVIAARNTAESARAAVADKPGDPAAMGALNQAESGLGGLLGRFFALSEAYPDLKANQTMMQLSEELTTTENKVAFARQAYNDAVLKYNNGREVFPTNIISGMFGFSSAAPFEVGSASERDAVKVSF